MVHARSSSDGTAAKASSKRRNAALGPTATATDFSQKRGRRDRSLGFNFGPSYSPMIGLTESNVEASLNDIPLTGVTTSTAPISLHMVKRPNTLVGQLVNTGLG